MQSIKKKPYFSTFAHNCMGYLCPPNLISCEDKPLRISILHNECVMFKCVSIHVKKHVISM